jgi:hypothetical protein
LGQVVALPGCDGDPWRRINEVWAEGRRAAGLSAHAVQYGPEKGAGRQLAARLDEHGLGPVLEVLRWWWHSEAAEWRRANVKTPMKAIARPGNFDEYLQAARDEGDNDSPAAIRRDLARGKWRDMGPGMNEF